MMFRKKIFFIKFGEIFFKFSIISFFINNFSLSQIGIENKNCFNPLGAKSKYVSINLSNFKNGFSKKTT